MSSTHTKEPWTPLPTTMKGKTRFVEINADDYERARACVNAMSGIDDPEAFVSRSKAIEAWMQEVAAAYGNCAASDTPRFILALQTVSEGARRVLSIPGGAA